MPPKVSVIIPCFNRGWCIQTAVQSVLNQSESDLELILVDDGSTDDTAVRVGMYHQDTRFHYIHQDHHGVSAARNRGVATSSAPRIAFLDSDDEWLGDKLAQQLAWMDAHPDVHITQTMEIWYRNGVRVNPRWIHRKQSGNIFALSLERCMITPSSVVMQRVLWDTFGGFDETLPACEDYALWLRITARHAVGLIREPLLIRHGGRPDQLSLHTRAMDRYRIKAMLDLLDQGGLSPEQKSLTLGCLKRKCHIYSQGCRKRGRIEEAMHYEHIADMAI